MELWEREFEAKAYVIFFRNGSVGIWHSSFAEPLDTQMPEDQQIERLFLEPVIDYCNKPFAKMYGFASPSELYGTRLLLFASERDEKNIATIRTFIRSGYNAKNLETHEIDREGNPHWFVNDVQSEFAGGNLIGIWGMQHEITQHKRLHDEREKIRRATSTQQFLLLQLLADGYDVKAAAHKMEIAVGTARIHLARLLEKFDIHTQEELKTHARSLGISHSNPLLGASFTDMGKWRFPSRKSK